MLKNDQNRLMNKKRNILQNTKINKKNVITYRKIVITLNIVEEITFSFSKKIKLQ